MGRHPACRHGVTDAACAECAEAYWGPCPHGRDPVSRCGVCCPDEDVAEEFARLRAAARDARIAALREAEGVCRAREVAWRAKASSLTDRCDYHMACNGAAEARFCASAIAALAGRETT